MVTMELFNCYLNINWNIASGENLVSGEIEYDFYWFIELPTVSVRSMPLKESII